MKFVVYSFMVKDGSFMVTLEENYECVSGGEVGYGRLNEIMMNPSGTN